MLFSLVLACTSGGHGPMPMVEVDGAFFDAPWPSDTRLSSDGGPDLADFPGVEDFPLLEDYTGGATAWLDGFGANTPIYFRFEGDVDESTLPVAAGSVEDGSSLFLVDIDRSSPHRGERVPVTWRFHSEGSRFVDERVLAVAPVFGFPLRAGTTYAAVVTTAAARQHPDFAEVFFDDHPDHERWEPLQEVLLELGVSTSEVAVATTFTVQDTVGELALFADYVHDLPVPDLDQDLNAIWSYSFFEQHEGQLWLPMFQRGEKPYFTEGGGFETEDGVPVLQGWERTRFSLCVPVDTDMPEDGWPVVLYAHGTGGDHQTACNSYDRREPARIVAEAGYALFSVSQPLHGDRATEDTDEEFHSFNYLNPESGRSTFRQSALETVYLARALAGRHQSFTTAEGTTVDLDPEQVWFMGHSQGGLTGGLALPFASNDLRGAVISGAGGGLTLTLIHRKEGLDIQDLLETLLDFDDDEELDEFHPVAALVQTLAEVTDPINLARYWFSEEGQFDHTPIHVLMFQGLLDEHTPPMTTDALSAAAGLPMLEPVASWPEVHDLAGLAPVALPTSANLPGGTTGGLAQFPDNDHFAVFDENDAAFLYGDLLQSDLVGEPTLSWR